MRDVEFPGDAHATVQLHGFFGDLLARRTDLELDLAERALRLLTAGVCRGGPWR